MSSRSAEAIRNSGLHHIDGGCLEWVGTAVGRDDTARTQFVVDKVNNNIKPLLEKLLHVDIDIQVAMHIIRASITSQLMYVFRTIPPKLCTPGATILRDMITHMFERKMIVPFGSYAHDTNAGKQLFLDISLGGLGFTDPLAVLRPAWMASVAMAVPDLIKTKPRVAAPPAARSLTFAASLSS